MDIYKSGFESLVSQEFLELEDPSACFKRMGGEGMPQCVDAAILCNLKHVLLPCSMHAGKNEYKEEKLPYDH